MNYKIYLFVISLIVLSGCSSSINSPVGNMANPGVDNDISSFPVGVSDRYPDGSPAAGMGALGVYQLRLDPCSVSADLAPLRNMASTDVLEIVDITNFLNIAPCQDCAKIRSVELDPDGNLVVNIGIRHPFPAGDPFKPISGRNRADLHVFNIEGTVISNLPVSFFPALNENVANFKLLNADGYSGYLDPVLEDIYPTQATVHPYIMHFDDYSAGNFSATNPMGFDNVTNPGPGGNLVMPMGSDYDVKPYVFKLDNPGEVDLIFAIGCTYPIASISKSQRFTPEYRVPQHNKKAASEVSVSVISNELSSGDTASSAQIEIHVVDINHGVPAGDALNQMFTDSSVSQIMVSVPAVMVDTLTIDGSISSSGTGHDPSDPLVYSATLTNTAAAIEGSYQGLVKVIDSYSPGLNTSPLLSGMDGIKRVGPQDNPLTGLFDIQSFQTYQVFTIVVGDLGNQPPVAGTLSLSWECPGDPCTGKPVTLTITEAYDPEGLPVTITWDFDGNLDFADDTDGDNTNLSGSFIFSSPGLFNAWCRVSDTVKFTDVGPFEINVLDCTPDTHTLLKSVDSAYDPGGYGRGRKLAVNMQDGYAYVNHETGSGGAVSIIDIDPIDSAYEIKYVELTGWTAAIAYYQGYVYVTGQAMQGIVVIDVDPPEDASIVGSWTNWSLSGSMEDMHVKGDYLYVAGQWGGFMRFDLSNPASPTLSGNYPTSSGRFTTSVAVSEDDQWGYFFEGYYDNTDWIRILDLSNPTAPVMVQTVQLSFMQTDITLVGDYLYTIPHPFYSGNNMNVIDVTDPLSPSFVTSLFVGDGTWDIKGKGNDLYIARGGIWDNNSGRLVVVDISNPASPSILTESVVPGCATGVEEYCGNAYCSATTPSLSIISLY